MKLDLFSIFWNLASVAMTVVIHSVGTLLIVSQRPRLFNFASHQRKLLRGQFVMTIIVIELLVLHLFEIGFWGLCLRTLGTFTSMGESLYFAGISYTSLGYTGALPSPRAGFSEVLIAMMGLLMFGWSVGILVTTVIQYEKLTLGWDPTSDAPSTTGPA
jgi:ABC-type uncharacterized transport system permease subunit